MALTPVIDYRFPAGNPLVASRGPNIDTATRSGTRKNIGSTGLIETLADGVLGVDHDPTTLANLGLGVWGAHENLFLWSEDFSQSEWGKSNVTIGQNDTTSPDGEVTADAFIENTSNGTHRVSQSASFVSGSLYTLSVFAKKATRDFLHVTFGSATFDSNVSAVFNLATGTVVSTGVSAIASSIIPMIDDWYWCTVTGLATGTGSNNQFLAPSSSDSAQNYQGINGQRSAYLWGADVGLGDINNGPYVPTGAAAVTRNAEVATLTDMSLYNEAEGGIYAEVTVGSAGRAAQAGIVEIHDDATADNRHLIFDDAGAIDVTMFVDSGNVNVVDATLGKQLAAGVTSRIAYGYKLNDFAGVIDTETLVADTTAIVPVSIAEMVIGGPLASNMNIKRLILYNTRPTDAELVLLAANGPGGQHASLDFGNRSGVNVTRGLIVFS